MKGFPRKTASGVASPCISVCTLSDTNGFCEGCYRTVDEITRWPVFSDEQKRNVLAALAVRRSERPPVPR